MTTEQRPWTDEEWSDDYQNLMTLQDLLPTLPGTNVGEDVWRMDLTDGERESLRGLEAKLAKLAEEDPDTVLRERASIVDHLPHAERAAFASFVAAAIVRTEQVMELAERALSELETVADRLSPSKKEGA